MPLSFLSWISYAESLLVEQVDQEQVEAYVAAVAYLFSIKRRP